ncbi:hypothetical protein BEWA_053970 [Theileria equi strain WA]|uniref:Signal peptide-containing protein n=1 Tax=Theileria equi strain WA TaxID=1537102 RepID=L1LDC1_THEEQ|nr:hypothetical protein BEWA_053970 [Theileria equi strain WA]EKX73341.1 hypothetical protein BEWA_053970 [Theileria equi strain WA]|eukprot:XP_004832793.1 hypothetical protein BEWA_053970 [Theileria equi strain WA]
MHLLSVSFTYILLLCKPIESYRGPIDVINPNNSISCSFDYIVDDIETRLIIPYKSSFITAIVESKNLIWKSLYEERCVMITLRLKDGKPLIAQMALILHPVVITKTLYKHDNLWKSDVLLMDTKDLKVHVDNITPFTLNIASGENEKCKAFETLMDKLLIRFYIPRPGYNATRVTCDGIKIWNDTPKIVDGVWKPQRRVVMTKVYMKDNYPYILHATVKDVHRKTTSKYFCRENDKWKKLKKVDFDSKRTALKELLQRNSKIDENVDEKINAYIQNEG